MRQPKKAPREKDLTSRYFSGGYDEDSVDQQQRFSDKSIKFQQRKTERTGVLRAAEESIGGDIDALPTGEVVQVFSLFSEVEREGVVRLCVARKTMGKLRESAMVVGDIVRFRATAGTNESGRPEAVIEQVLPRRSVLTRTDSFKGVNQQPIVANADQMLIVASLIEPRIKWGLIDRMVIAALGGNLRPVLCLNKIDLETDAPDDWADARRVLEHYRSIGHQTLETSAVTGLGLDALREILLGKTTVLSGHSGVGKSSLIRAIQPALDLRVGEISSYTGKGRHTTSSARRYVLDFGGRVIDTPGVKLFGLWGVTRENLGEFYPDLEREGTPEWRKESYRRIHDSLPEEA